MTARAFAQDSWETDGVKVAIKPTRNSIMLWDDFPTIQTYDPETASSPTVDENVWLHLPQDTGRALYEALDRYYGGSAKEGDTRADLLHERKRVDHFIGVVTKKEINQ